MAGFQQIGEREVESGVVEHPAAQAKTQKDNSAALQMLMLGIKVLSQRTLIAFSNLFTLVALTSAFWLWWNVLVAPTVNQLVGIGGYSLFILALEFIRRR